MSFRNSLSTSKEVFQNEEGEKELRHGDGVKTLKAEFASPDTFNIWEVDGSNKEKWHSTSRKACSRIGIERVFNARQQRLDL